MSALRILAVRLAWLLVAVLISLGCAGVVAAMNHVPGTEARAELTWTGDRAAEQALDAATERLQALGTEVDRLGSTGRQALAAVVAGDTDQVNATVAAGTLQLGNVEAAAAALEAAIAAVPGVGEGSDLSVSPDLRARYEELATTKGLTASMRTDWRLFTGRALDASNLSGLLVRHDQQTAAAAQQGAAASYRAALDLLDTSDATIAEIRRTRDRLAATTDVSTLTTWVDRNAAYDAALRTLYEALRDADGKVTDAVRDAYTGEQRARRNLPVDTRPLVVIMADVAQGGLNQAVISIEEASDALSLALDVQRSYQQGIELPE